MGALLVWTLVCARSGGVVAPARALAALSPCILAFALFYILMQAGSFRRIVPVLLSIYALAECALGTAQLAGWLRSRHAFYPLTGNFLNPAPYACLLAVAIVVCVVALLRREGGKYLRILYLTTAIWSSVLVIAAQSRAVWLGLALALLAASARETDILHRSGHKRLTLCCVAVIFIVGCAGAWMLKPESAMARLHTWQIDCRAMADHPLTGVGPGAGMGAFADAQAGYFHDHVRSMGRQMAADVPQKPFNEFLGIGMACGIPGFILAVAVFILALLLSLTRRSLYAYPLIVIGTFAFFSFPLCQTALVLLLMLSLADAASHGGGVPRGVSIAMALLSCAMVPFVCTETGRMCELRKLTAEYKASPLDSGALSGHYESLRDEPEYLLLYGKSLYDEGRYSESSDVFERLARLTADPVVPLMQGEARRALGDPSGAASCYLKSYYIAPSRLTALYFLSNLYRGCGLDAEARRTAEYALSLPVEKKYAATMEVRTEIEELLLSW